MYTSKIRKEVPTVQIEETEVTLSLTQYIANRIKTLREEKGMNFSDLSFATNKKLSNSSISSIEKYLEKDEKYPSYNFKALVIIAEALGVDVMELFPYKEYIEAKDSSLEEALKTTNG